ncbi:hypothetical protein JCM10212_006712 [Sporobolomyces blumeae]
MAAGISKTTTIPLLALTFIFSVITLGLVAHIEKVGSFPASNFHGVIIQLTFAAAWTTLFSLVFMITGFVLSRNSFFSAGVVGIFIFLSFLQLIVGAGGLVAVLKKYGTPDNGSLYKALQAFAFISAFFALFTTVAAFLNYVAGKAVDVQPKKEEEVHF